MSKKNSREGPPFAFLILPRARKRGGRVLATRTPKVEVLKLLEKKGITDFQIPDVRGERRKKKKGGGRGGKRER